MPCSFQNPPRYSEYPLLRYRLNEEVIDGYIGPQRPIGCLVVWGGVYIEPGHIQYGGQGPMRVGELDGSVTERLNRVCSILKHIAPTDITDNIL